MDRVSQANVLFHVFDSPGVVVDLLLHLALVFLEVGQALLQEQVFLFLGSEGRVVSVASQLELGHDVGHVILIHRLKHVPHLFNLSTILL